MRNLVLALVAGVATVVFASPSESQDYPRHHNGYGYSYRDPGGLERRIDNVLRSLGGVAPEYRGQLRAEAFSLDRRLHYASRNGLNYYEAHDIDVRIGELERQLGRAHDASYGRRDRYYSARARHDDRWREQHDRKD
jgi:hypothetical protein